MGSRGGSKVNSASTTATVAYTNTSEFNLTAGTVGTVAVHKLDFDYTAGSITNAYFIWANESSFSAANAAVSGEKDFRKSDIPWPALLGGGLTATEYAVSALNTAVTNANDTGTVGEIRFTADYIFVCVASNTWKRVALSSW